MDAVSVEEYVNSAVAFYWEMFGVICEFDVRGFGFVEKCKVNEVFALATDCVFRAAVHHCDVVICVGGGCRCV